MKKINFILAAVMLMSSAGVHAQFGVKAGYVNSSAKIDFGYSVKAQSQSGFFVAANYEIPFAADGLALRPGLTYTYLGGETPFKRVLEIMADENMPAGLTVNGNEHILSLPIDVRYSFPVAEKLNMYLFAGPRVDYGLSSTIDYSYAGVTFKGNFYTGKVTYTYDGQTESETPKEGGTISRLDVMIGAGAGVRYGKVSIELGYDMGLLNRARDEAFKDSGINPSYKRNQFTIGVGYTF